MLVVNLHDIVRFGSLQYLFYSKSYNKIFSIMAKDYQIVLKMVTILAYINLFYRTYTYV